MIDIPLYIPVNTKKLKEYILYKYNININVNGEFIEEILEDKYHYHVFKKGKKKDTIEFKKSNKSKSEVKCLKNLIFKDDIKKGIIKNQNEDILKNNNNLNTEINKKETIITHKNLHNITSSVSKIKFTSREEYKNNIRYIITKRVICKCNEKNQQILYLRNNNRQLKYFYNFLLDKHKNTFNFFKSLVLGLKKIHKNMKNMNIDNMEYKKLIHFVEKIIPNNILFNNLM